MCYQFSGVWRLSSVVRYSLCVASWGLETSRLQCLVSCCAPPMTSRVNEFASAHIQRLRRPASFASVLAAAKTSPSRMKPSPRGLLVPLILRREGEAVQLERLGCGAIVVFQIGAPLSELR